MRKTGGLQRLQTFVERRFRAGDSHSFRLARLEDISQRVDRIAELLRTGNQCAYAVANSEMLAV